MVDFRDKFIGAEVIETMSLQYRFSFVGAEQIQDRQPWLKESYLDAQSIYDHQPALKLSYIEVQSIVLYEPSPWEDANTEGSDMSTEIFPELIGLTWDIKRRPIFNNVVQDHLSGKETRLAFWDRPKWEFELSYEYLPNIPKQVGDTDLERIMGFFLERKGNFQSFLYRFKDDYKVSNGLIGTGTGTASEYEFVRRIGPYSAPVDFVDYTLVPPVFRFEYGSTAYVIPANPGPYTVTVFPNLLATGAVQIGATVLTRVLAAPSANQYALDEVTGVFTFHSSRAGQTFTLSSMTRRLTPGDYQLTVPNKVTFLATVPNGVLIYADFEFYYNVRFSESEAEFNEFVEALYELEEITLRSVFV